MRRTINSNGRQDLCDLVCSGQELIMIGALQCHLIFLELSYFVSRHKVKAKEFLNDHRLSECLGNKIIHLIYGSVTV